VIPKGTSRFHRKSNFNETSFPIPLANYAGNLGLIYYKPQKFVSGNKIGGKLQQRKDCPIYLG